MRPVHAAGAEALAGALEANAGAVVQMAPGHCTFAPHGAPGLRASAWLTDHWLLVDAPFLEPAGGVTAWEVFAANALLPAGLKGCTGGSDPALRLRAELPILEHRPVAQSVQEVCVGLAAAVACFRPETLGARPPWRTETSGGSIAAADVDLRQLCAETSWPCTMRGSDTVMVELDVPGTFQQATVEMHPHRGVVVSVPVLPEPPRAPVCETAVGAFLLQATGAVRLARAATRTARGPLCFEVVCTSVPATPTAAELAHAFAALSLAWRCAGREAVVLAGDERIAQLYLDRAPPRIAGACVQESTTNNQQLTT